MREQMLASRKKMRKSRYIHGIATLRAGAAASDGSSLVQRTLE